MVNGSLEDRVTSFLGDLAEKEHEKRPVWGPTEKWSHYVPLKKTVFLEDYYLTVWKTVPEKREDIWKVVSWELAHTFKHYIDDVRFEKGDERGRRIKPHVENRKTIRIEEYKFEEQADIYANGVTGTTLSEYLKLRSELRPWNINLGRKVNP